MIAWAGSRQHRASQPEGLVLTADSYILDCLDRFDRLETSIRVQMAYSYCLDRLDHLDRLHHLD